MAKLYFKVGSDVDKVIKLREEITKLKQEITNMSKGDASKTQKRINQATKEITSLVTEAAKAGQVFENDLKKKIFDSSKVVDTFSSKIINQKAVVRDVQADVRSLAEAYRNMSDININKGHTLKELQSARKVLDEEKASLFGLQQEQAKARLSVKGLKDEYSLLKDESKQVVNVNQGLAFSWKKMLGIIGGAAVLKKLSSDIVNVRGDMEALGNSYEVLLGSRKKAESLVSEIVDYAVATPFSTGNISGAAQTLLGFNVEAEKVMPTLKQIGDISMGNAQRFDSLALAFAQSSAAGRLLGGDLNQMINAGFNPLQVISEQTGKSLAELKKEMGEGGITSEMVAKAFEDATAEGGKFHGMLLKNSDSVNTIRNQFEGAFEKMYNDLGTKGEGVIKFSYKAGISLVNNYETVGKVLASSVAVLGTYKTALILNELWERRLVVIRTLAIKKQIALNAVMNANPYALLATTIVGLYAAVWTLSDSTSAAERAQKKFNKEKEDAIAKEQEHKSKIDALIDSSKNEALGNTERRDSLEALRKEYPKIFEKYDIETIKLAEILKLKREIAEEEGRRKVLSNKEKVTALEKELLELEHQKDTSKSTSSASWNLMDKNIQQKEKEIELAKEEVRKDEFNAWKKSLNDLTDKQINELIKENRRLYKATKDETQKDNLQESYDALSSELSIRGTRSTYQQDLIKAKKDWDDAKKELQKIVKDKDSFTAKQYREAKKNVETKESIYKDLGGVVDTPKSKKTEKDKEVQSQVRDQEDLENQVTQSRIDAMKSGNEKVIAQLELNHKKELQAIERNKEDYLKKKIAIEKSLSENEGKKFDASSVTLSVGENEMFDNLKGATNEKYSNQLSAVYADLLTKYQGYTEKRLEAQKKFQTDRENLVKAGASKESLDENSYQETKALEAIDNEFAMREDSFQAWADRIVNISLEKLKELLAEAKEELESMEKESPNNSNLASQRAKVNTLSSTVDKAESKTPSKRSVKEWGDLYKVLGKVDKQFDEIGDTIGGTVGDVIKAAGGISTATLQMVDGIVTLANSSSTAMSGTAKAASTAIQTVEKASVILAIIGAALQIATKISDMFGADYSKYEKAKENYENYVEVLDQVIDKQKELIETMTGDAAVKASKKALDLIDKQIEAARILGKQRLNSGASGGSHSIGVRQWKRINREELAEAEKALWKGFYDGKRMTGLFDLSVEQMEKLKNEAPTFWSKLDDDVRQYLDQIITGNEKIEEMKELLNESLTQVSFNDIRSDYLDMLMDFDSSSKDMAENLQEYLQRAILNSMLVDKYQGRLRGWYETFARANKDSEITKREYDNLQNQWNKIAEDAIKERDAMMDMFGWESEGKKQESSRGGFTAMGQDSADELNGRFTYNNVLLEQLKGETLSHSETMNYLRADLGEVLLTTKGTRDIADEIRTIQVNSYLELQEINEHTGNTVKELKKIASDIQEVKRNTSKL